MKTEIITEYIKKFPALYKSEITTNIFLFIDRTTGINLEEFDSEYFYVKTELDITQFNRLTQGYFIELEQNKSKLPALYNVNNDVVLVYNYDKLYQHYEGYVLISDSNQNIGNYIAINKPLRIKNKLPDNTKIRFTQE